MPKAAPERGDYYVFEMSMRNRREPLRQVNKAGPLTLEKAKQLARIGATKGKHDRAVTTSPTSTKFRIVAQYAAGTGKDVAIMYRRGSGGGGKRRVRRNPAAAMVVVEDTSCEPSPPSAFESAAEAE